MNRIFAPTLAALLAGLTFSAGAAQAQAFGSGPLGTPTGSSMSGARIVGQPKVGSGNRVPNARVFGDTAEERAYGKDYDDSYIKPKVRKGIRSGKSNAERAAEGRSSLDPAAAGAYALDGPTAIGRSAVTRNSTFSRGGRARIVKPAP